MPGKNSKKKQAVSKPSDPWELNPETQFLAFAGPVRMPVEKYAARVRDVLLAFTLQYPLHESFANFSETVSTSFGLRASDHKTNRFIGINVLYFNIGVLQSKYSKYFICKSLADCGNLFKIQYYCFKFL